jgi:hypothetical protein
MELTPLFHIFSLSRFSNQIKFALKDCIAEFCSLTDYIQELGDLPSSFDYPGQNCAWDFVQCQPYNPIYEARVNCSNLTITSSMLSKFVAKFFVVQMHMNKIQVHSNLHSLNDRQNFHSIFNYRLLHG